MLRRGGELARVVENLNYISTQIKNIPSLRLFRMDFVVQALNFREMPDFVRLANSLGAFAYFSQIVSWGTYSPEEFPNHAIWDSKHPDHQEFLEILRDPIFKSGNLFLGNINGYFNKANAQINDSDLAKSSGAVIG